MIVQCTWNSILKLTINNALLYAPQFTMTMSLVPVTAYDNERLITSRE